MNRTLKSPRFAATLPAPTSKSAVHRMLIAAAFADRPTSLPVYGAGADIAATARCLSSLGATVTVREGAVDVIPAKALPSHAVLDCGESGSTLRFLLPVAAALGVPTDFLRAGRLPERPLSPLDAELAAHGAVIADGEGGVLTCRGSITAGHYRMAANVSSQFVTGLLFALSLLPAPSVLELYERIESAPYIDMTLRALAAFGAAPKVSDDGRRYEIAGFAAAPFKTPDALLPEGDFSGAAFPLSAGALGKTPVTVTGLDMTSPQGDKAIISLLREFGADVTVQEHSVTVAPAPLHGIRIDASQIPDLVPVLAVVAAGAAGETEIFGAERLRLKESDRIATTAALLRALGGDVTERPDGLTIRGGKPLSGGTVDGANDHRIVMSAAVAALITDGAVTITDAEAVAKSYPRFFEEALV